MPLLQTLLFRVGRYYLSPVVVVIVSLYPKLSAGGEVIEATVEHQGGQFTLHINVLIQVPVSRTRDILTDFKNLPKLNNGIRQVEMLSQSSAGNDRMRVDSEICIMYFCLNFSWVQEVEIIPSGDIITRIEPQWSDFRKGWTRYRLRPVDNQTRLIMDAEVVPDFWIPPLIGPLVIKNKLRNEALETALGVERLANANESNSRFTRLVISPGY